MTGKTRHFSKGFQVLWEPCRKYMTEVWSTHMHDRDVKSYPEVGITQLILISLFCVMLASRHLFS